MLAAKIDLNKMAALSELVSQRVWAAILSKLQFLMIPTKIGVRGLDLKFHEQIF